MANSAVYQVASKAASPLTLALLKPYVKQEDTTADDVTLQSIIDAVTAWGERYAARDFRQVTYVLLLDELEDRICLKRPQIDAIQSVQRLVSSVWTSVSSSLYYTKKLVNITEIILKDDESWPEDADEIEQAYRINFTTAASMDYAAEILQALKQHAINMYMNRGDADDLFKGADESGATRIYNQFRIQRV